MTQQQYNRSMPTDKVAHMRQGVYAYREGESAISIVCRLTDLHGRGPVDRTLPHAQLNSFAQIVYNWCRRIDTLEGYPSGHSQALHRKAKAASGVHSTHRHTPHPTPEPEFNDEYLEFLSKPKLREAVSKLTKVVNENTQRKASLENSIAESTRILAEITKDLERSKKELSRLQKLQEKLQDK